MSMLRGLSVIPAITVITVITVITAIIVVLALVPPLQAASGTSLWDWFLIPAAAYVEGSHGTFWRTDVSIVNPYQWQSITVSLKFLAD